MTEFGKLAGAGPIRDDVAGAVPVEYALIAGTIVFAITGALRVITAETAFGLTPVMVALRAVLS